MNRFRNGLLIRKGHVTWQLMHHSEYLICENSIAHFLALLVFFGTHLKSPSFVRDFLNYFYRVADMLNSPRREFQFFLTTLSFWDF